MLRRASTVSIAKRSIDRPIPTIEIEAPDDSAGYEVVATLTQARDPHSRFRFGSGKVETIATRAEATDADVVSWCHDHGTVHDVTYGDSVTVDFECDPRSSRKPKGEPQSS